MHLKGLHSEIEFGFPIVGTFTYKINQTNAQRIPIRPQSVKDVSDGPTRVLQASRVRPRSALNLASWRQFLPDQAGTKHTWELKLCFQNPLPKTGIEALIKVTTGTDLPASLSKHWTKQVQVATLRHFQGWPDGYSSGQKQVEVTYRRDLLSSGDTGE